MEMQGTQNSQNNLEKKNKVGELTLPAFKTYYNSIIMMTVDTSIK